jgi:hypothetical protein
MKRIRDPQAIRRLHQSRYKRVLAERARRAAFIRRRNTLRREGVTLEQAEQSPRFVPDWNAGHISGPRILSLLKNPEGVASFVAKIKDNFDRQKPVFVDLKAVDEIDYDGLAVLLSVLVRFKAKKIPFNGRSPAQKAARAVLEESRFFGHLLSKPFKDENSYKLGARSIVTHANLIVDSELAQSIVEEAALTIWGERRRCHGVYRALIELMHNTNNHAGSKDGDKHWWLSVKHFEAERRVTFSFLDFGIGVFKSLQTKPSENRLFGILDKLRERLLHGSDADVLRLIFEGELHKTSTGKYYRGKGLPGVYQAWQKNDFSRLAMITNKVFFDSATNEYRPLDVEFQGTFVHWELSQHNRSLAPCA